MTPIAKSAAILAALALAGCSTPERFMTGGGGAGAGGGSVAMGDPSNPASMAYFTQTVGGRVFFAVDQSSLSAEARDTLEQQARWLIANTGYSAVIEGHADEQGTREYNLALGARRANAAREYLVSRGVSPTRLRTVTYGKERPIEVCSVESCYAKNRRAVTVLSAGAGS
ncbi:18K peptidoglycan-associated outer membrane lipoprotein [Rhodovulum sp. P5]|uniref:peptidoglycan-associated lipoprotein Pal n=1 Tax=Rhodovulum sp. P5 TaxID=1564506 RepID=UPI0009C2A435|nr:peptidoglycan-associated lipoprotein Pal [Rhodovulum sp. P5]ARE39797.1 18K peptidoglycan-associated outer membrane lipoprotein [Rhodovulum sp. P5]